MFKPALGGHNIASPGKKKHSKSGGECLRAISTVDFRMTARESK